MNPILIDYDYDLVSYLDLYISDPNGICRDQFKKIEQKILSLIQ
jgi:hypothetical protein